MKRISGMTFNLDSGTETVLVALMDGLWRERDRGCATIVALLDFSVAFETVSHDIRLGWLHEF